MNDRILELLEEIVMLEKIIAAQHAKIEKLEDSAKARKDDIGKYGGWEGISIGGFKVK